MKDFSMKVLVVGKGGREHAIITALNESPSETEIFSFPGSDAIFELATPVQADGVASLVSFMKDNEIDLCVAGEESYLAKDASALFHVSKEAAPFLIMHGSEDPGVPLVQSTTFHEALQKAGAKSELVIVEGAGHGGKGFQTIEVRNTVRTFFIETLKP
ncbi:prolyl oligopeptidase family serine peptidase [Verrucomicrobiales bacterium]|nr:prolyl oligopeptidase family serine peptidase [Verrucomicrobiales bacterium]